MSQPWYQPFVDGTDYHEQYRGAFGAFAHCFEDPENAREEALVRLIERLPNMKRPAHGNGEAFVMTAYLNHVRDLNRAENGRMRVPKQFRELGPDVESIYRQVKRGVPVDQIIEQSDLSPVSVRETVRLIKANPLPPLRPARASLESPESGQLRPEVECGTDTPEDGILGEIEAEEQLAIIAFALTPPGSEPEHRRFLGPAAVIKARQMQAELAIDQLDRALLREIDERSPTIGEIAKLFCRTTADVKRQKSALVERLASVFEAHGFGPSAGGHTDESDAVPDLA